MSYLLAIDPGTHHLAIAAFDASGELRLAYLEREYPKPLDLPVTKLVIELPQVYAAGKSKGDPNDLVLLAYSAGRATLLAPFAEVQLVKPQAWKGGLKKHHVQERAIAELSEAELMRVRMPIKSLAHNVFDAIGIGLRVLGRMGKILPRMERGPLQL